MLTRTHPKRSAASRRGVTAVEMALVMTLLALFIAAGFEMSRLMSLRQTAEHASYAGARVGIISGASANDVRTAAQVHLDALDIRDAVVEVTPATIQEETTLVSVSVTIPMAQNSWGVPNFLTTSLTGRSTLLTERAAMVMSESIAEMPSGG
ncbi:MAG: TadE family protein [Planctomycetota bacterium]